ncbi:MAG: sigma 54-interacting transcriptional regulator [Desulfomonilaceae bacterium]|nr:sigma 54-interacting transcriptional regulator [Desulfomonilaceae bacterium]
MSTNRGSDDKPEMEAKSIEDLLLDAFVGPLFDLPLGVIIVDAAARVRFFNAMAGYYLGITPSLVVGKHVLEIFPQAIIEDILSTGVPRYDLKEEVNQRQLRCSFAPIRIGGRVLFVAGFLQDHSKRVELESQLTRLSQKYDLVDSLLDNSFEELAAVDRQGRVTYLTRKTAQRMGIDRAEALGWDVTSINPACLLKEVARSGVPRVTEICGRRKGGVPVLVSPIVEDGSIEGAVCRSIFTDFYESEEFLSLVEALHTGSVGRKRLKRVSSSRFTFAHIVGSSEVMSSAKTKAERVAKGNSIVLVTGESGTGKELFAQAIHAASLRKNRPFVVVNCAGIPETLLESELFGYESGSFTGARAGGKPGKFELAHNGTLFLDECGEMSMGMQAKMLRIIQEKEFQRVGGSVTYEVDVRIIAATNRDLWDMVQKGQFREDLYYRLDVVNIHIPPLRARMEDVPLLVDHFIPQIREVTRGNVRGVADEVLDLFTNYPWPGNVRELRNVLEGAMNLNTGELIDVAALPSRIAAEMSHARDRIGVPWFTAAGPFPDREDMEKTMIESAIRTTKGNKRKAAMILQISRATLYNKLRKYRIE